MSKRPLLLHLNRVKNTLGSMDSRRAFTFAAACTERQWPVYHRASAGKSWEKQAVLRHSLDTIWRWLAGRVGHTPGLAQQCEAAVFDDDPTHDEDTGAFYVANNFYGLAAIIETDEPQHSYQSARSNLDLVDAFLDVYLGLPVSAANDLVLDAHELMQDEMRRQIADLQSLEQPLTAAVVEEMRRRSDGESVLGAYWYVP